MTTHVEVFNFTSSSCKKIEEFPYDLVATTQGTCANGVIHWIASRRQNNYVIVCFDFVEERFKEVPKPDCLGETSKFDLGVLDGCLCVVLPLDTSQKEFEVWAMKEYGVKESWTKLIDIEIECSGNLIPLGHRKNGEVLVEVDQKRLVAYNPREKTKEVIVLTQNQDGFHGVTYLESLISPEGHYGIRE
ncbi:F-box/kelch-repeat protein [Actinidia chinensis var. chinensis]|uniref:F-box/kelch-repeat protein n=1 Tax=Actinidia chinensis var. chinensis TaxID=1590841 RepID=A0A2R6P4U4_ACTCC|nr:F-box/kelch-repeat protein [Actinidia chinensis var. chinensis]